MKPVLYSIVPEYILKSMAQTFYACLHLPIQIINDKGGVLISEGDSPGFCKLFQKHLPPSESCKKCICQPAKELFPLGNAIFSHVMLT